MASGEYHCTIFPADASQAISTDEVLLSTHKHISCQAMGEHRPACTVHASWSVSNRWSQTWGWASHWYCYVHVL